MAPRKKAEVQVTLSKEAIVAELATQIWGKLYSPVDDAEANAAAYKTGSDMLQKFMEQLRKRRDDSKPIIRERRETTEVLAEGIGKNLTDLQGAYIQLPIGTSKGGETLYERCSIPRLRTYTESEGHPMHQLALDFMKASKVQFVNRPGKAKGKEITVLEAVGAKKPANATA